MDLNITRYTETFKRENPPEVDESGEDYAVRLCMALGMSAGEAAQFVLEAIFS